MKPKTFFLLHLFFIFLVAGVSASDSIPGHKKGLLSFRAGYTYNTVYGSMVDRNEQFDPESKMKKKSGFLIQVDWKLKLAGDVSVKSGIGFIYKQVFPQEDSYVYYQDKLKTGYLIIPALISADLFPEESMFGFSPELGVAANVRIIDKSYRPEDRGFRTSFLTASLCAGAMISVKLDAKTKFLLQYNYMHDISDTYIERLYWSSAEPDKKFVYRYKTSAISLGFQWPL